MKDRVERYIYLAMTAIVCWHLALWLRRAPDDVFRVLLYPHKMAVGIFYHMDLFYHAGTGYLASDYGFAIGRECLGSNFILILFAMNACMFLKYFEGYRRALWWFGCLAGASALGISVSCIRIIGSIPFAGHPKFPMIHVIFGISLYFSALFLSYVSLRKYFEAKSGSDECEKAV